MMVSTADSGSTEHARIGRWAKGFVLLSGAVYLLAAGLHVVAGRIHVDEGAYLYAANRVMAGELPYRDFFYLQPPVHPYLYGIVQRALGPGLITGRATSAVLGLIAGVVAVWVGYRLLPRWETVVVASGLLGWNVYQNYFFSISRQIGRAHV